MPYIKSVDREFYDAELDLVLGKLHDKGFPEGDVVYVLYRLAVGWWIRSSRRFKDLNHIRGAFHSTIREFDRKIADPYEDSSIVNNGDLKEIVR